MNTLAKKILSLACALALAGCAAASLDARPDVRASFRESCAPTAAEKQAAKPGVPVMADLGAFDPEWRGRCIAGRLNRGRLEAFVKAPPPPALAQPSAPPPPRVDVRPVGYAALPGWSADAKGAALAAFRASCGVMLRRPADAPFGRFGSYGDWQPACRAALTAADDAAGADAFFTDYFRPWQATGDGNPDGLFTGYYELTLDGARTRHGAYQTPLRAMPGDMVTADLGDFVSDLHGRSIKGRVEGASLQPYPDRRAIEDGKLAPGQDRPFVWVDDPIRAFFLQIQGSGIVRLEEGGTMAVAYAGQNGRPYRAIGAELIHRGELAKDQVSMQSIDAWLRAHPDRQKDLLATNPSYVFFRDAGPEQAAGPKGAQGILLTPGRSLAVDRARVPYGAPVFVSAAPPRPGDAPFNRLMIAQDTGGAIKGAVRGDVFWGRGADAEARAGIMKSPGRMWLLLPKNIQPE